MRKVRRSETRFLTLGSLFAGVGGFDAAAEGEGIPVVSWSEFDPSANKQVNQAVLEAQFPGARALGDVSGISYADLGHPSVLTAGSPCQGFSVAGLRAGMIDARSGLFAQFVRIRDEGLEDGRLKYAVWENVPGALNSNKGEDFANVLAAMVGSQPIHLPRYKGRGARYAGVARGFLGFFAWRTLDAQYFGVAQRRQRVYGVWSRGHDAIRALFGEEGVQHYLDTEADVSVQGGFAWLFDTPETPFNAGKEPDTPVQVKLSQVLEHDVDEKYDLSEKACRGILTRAGRRGRKLPAILDYALKVRAGADPGEFPLDDVVTVLGVDPTWVTKAGGIGENVAPGMRENSWKDPHFVVVPVAAFRKSRRAQSDTDDETWEKSESSNTLNLFEYSAVRATNVVVGFIVEPESGQGADLKARATETSDALLVNWLEKTTDRGLRVVEVAELEPQSVALRGREGGGSAELGEPGTANTLRSSQGGGDRAYVLVPVQWRVRRLTPRECERLQGFPDDHTLIDGAKDSHRYRQMGNAVAVPNAAWVLARLKAVHEGRELPDLPEVLEKLPWLHGVPRSQKRRRVVRR